MGDGLGFGIGNALTAGLDQWNSSLDRKFREKQALEAVAAAKRRDETERMLGLVRAEAQQHAAETSAGARRYAADAGYSGRTEAANTSADARGYAAEQGLKGRQYGADKSLEGRRYAADTGLTGRRYSADQGLKGAQTRAGATVDAAKIGAGSRVDAANIGAGARGDAASKSLYGTMFRPRPADPLAPQGSVPAAPPKFSDWMQQTGLPSVKPAGMGATPDVAAPAAGAPGAKPIATAAPKPEHLATAADYVKKIRDANAKGDLEGAVALKKEAAKFLSTVQAPTPGSPDDDGDGFDDGTDDDDADDDEG